MIFKKKYRAAKRDFTVEDLPSDRYEVFFDLVQNRWQNLLILGVILLIAGTPFLLVRYYGMLATTGIFRRFESGEIGKEAAFQAILGLNNFINLIFIPCLVLFGLGLAGGMRIVKKLAWSEYFSIRHDFVSGIKENGIHLVAVIFLIGAGNFVLSYLKTLNLFSETYENNLFSYLPEAGFALLIFPILAYFVSLTAVYREKATKKLLVSFRLYLLNLPKTVLVAFAGMAPLLLLLIRNSLLQLLFPFLYLLLISPVFLLLWFLFSCHVFDKFINLKNFPEIYDKGVWRKRNEK